MRNWAIRKVEVSLKKEIFTLLNELREKIGCEGLRSILSFFHNKLYKFNNI